MLCPVSSLRGVAFLGAATPPTHSPVAAAYIRVLRDDRTDRIESRMIDLNPVTKTKTKTCMCPTHHSYRLPDHESEDPGLLGRVRPRCHGSLQTDRGGFHTTCRVKRRDVLVSGLKCDGWRNVFMYSRCGPGCGPTRVGDSPSPPSCGAAFSSVARISAMLLNLPCGG